VVRFIALALCDQAPVHARQSKPHACDDWAN
jgi:hypothetical protein